MQPSKLLVQDYLRTRTFGDLEREYGVNVSVSKSRPYKFALNYDQIASKPSPLVNQCRGVILRTIPSAPLPLHKDELASVCPGVTMVIARPFDRFFNHGDPSAADVDWDDPGLEFQEKLDGTLAVVYYDDISGDWCMATRSVPDADLLFEYWGGSMTFRQLFDAALLNTTGISDLQEFMYGVHTDLTFCFELTAPHNRIVVAYEREGITWLGTRHRLHGKELGYAETLRSVPADLTPRFPPAAAVHPCSTLASAVAMLATKGAHETEGVIARDSSFRRVKVKSAAWLAANKIKSACGTQRGLLQLILMGKEDDVVSLLPEASRPLVPRMKSQLHALCAALDDSHKAYLVASEGVRKAYALLVTSSDQWQAPLFDLFVGRAPSARQWVDSKRDPSTGEWPDAFLDKILERLSAVNPGETPA